MFDGFVTTGGLIAGIIAIVFGVVVFVWPKALAYLVGVFFIIFGVITLISIYG